MSAKATLSFVTANEFILEHEDLEYEDAMMSGARWTPALARRYGSDSPVYFSKKRPASINCLGGSWTLQNPYWITLDRICDERSLADWQRQIRKIWWTVDHAIALDRLAREHAFPTARRRK